MSFLDWLFNWGSDSPSSDASVDSSNPVDEQTFINAVRQSVVEEFGDVECSEHHRETQYGYVHTVEWMAEGSEYFLRLEREHDRYDMEILRDDDEWFAIEDEERTSVLPSLVRKIK